jgi:hypothetical protein
MGKKITEGNIKQLSNSINQIIKIQNAKLISEETFQDSIAKLKLKIVYTCILMWSFSVAFCIKVSF